MSHNFFAGDLEQAVCGGIEELTDYTLVVKGKKSGKLLKRKLSAKKSLHSDYIDNGEDCENNEQASPCKKSKKNVFQVTDVDENVKTDIIKKKKKKKVVKPAINLSVFDDLAVKAEVNVEPISNGKSDVGSVEKENTKYDSGKVDENLIKTKTVKKKKCKKSKEKTVIEVDTSSAVDVSEMGQWKDLFVCEEIVKALAEKGFKSPTPIQKLTLPASIQGKMDIVGAAETGSGKTLAFGIPIIQGILEDKKYEEKHGSLVNGDYEGSVENIETDENEKWEVRESAVNVVDNVELDFDLVEEQETVVRKHGDKLRALILTPTRELAMQIHNHLAVVARHTEVRVAVVVGGLSVEKQIRLLSRGPAIVVATPGRLWDLVQEGNSHLLGLSTVRYLAIDETDRMVERGHFEELQKILELLNADSNKDNRRQTFIMSATLSLVHKPPQHARKQKQKSPEEKLGELMEAVGVKQRRKVVDITRKVGTAETLSESVIHCALTEKDFFLYYFVKSHPGRTVVFCNSIDCVRRLTNLFSLLDVTPLPLHAQLHQKQRLKNLDRFSASNSGLLIATDVAARGLDIPDIEHVVHYQVPRTSESYVHRSGRTARATRQGLSLLLVEPGEQNLFRKLCQTLAKDGEQTLPTFPIDQNRMGVVRERVGLARQLDKLMLDSRKKSVGESWRTKTAEEADLVLSDENDSEEEFYQGRLEGNSKQSVEHVKKQLQQMLKSPLTQQVYGGSYPTMGGGLPTDLLNKKAEKAVDALQSNLKYTQNLLRGKKKPEKHQNKFKGFKKKKRSQ